MQACARPGCGQKPCATVHMVNDENGGHDYRDPELDRLRNENALAVGRAYEVPMSLIDGRPWVPTAAEADPGVDEADEPTMVYARDASWYRRPDTRVPKKMHRESGTHPETPACNPGGVLLAMESATVSTTLSESRLCGRCFPGVRS